MHAASQMHPASQCHARQVHEPILTRSGSAALAAEFGACYAALAAVGLPINLVVPYDDVEGPRPSFLFSLIGLGWMHAPTASCAASWHAACKTVGPRIYTEPLHRSFLNCPACCCCPTCLPDAEETYCWLVQLPVAAISLDFLGVPGGCQVYSLV